MSEHDPTKVRDWLAQCAAVTTTRDRLALLALLGDKQIYDLLYWFFEMPTWERGNALHGLGLAVQLEPELLTAVRELWLEARKLDGEKG